MHGAVLGASAALCSIFGAKNGARKCRHGIRAVRKTTSMRRAAREQQLRHVACGNGKLNVAASRVALWFEVEVLLVVLSLSMRRMCNIIGTMQTAVVAVVAEAIVAACCCCCCLQL